MSLLSKAAKRFDERFAAQPPEVRKAIALAIYRVFPAIQQYQKDLAPLAADEEIADATWDLAIAVAFQLVKRGRDAFGQKTIDELSKHAPHTVDFMRAVGRMIDGLIPGGTGLVEPTDRPPLLMLEPMPDDRSDGDGK